MPATRYMPPIRPTVFLDFDGTITTRDVTDAILETFADPEWLRVEEEWETGRIGSRECLMGQMALVRATREQINALLDDIEVDEGFTGLLELCSACRVPVHVVSDGFDYCIRRILSRPSLNLAPYLRSMRIVSSHIEPDGVNWRASFTGFGQSCVHGCATCKPAAMASLNTHGAPTIFVGDGLSDRYAAAYADLVFAKGKLAEYCDERAIPYTLCDNLTTVAARLDALLESDVVLRRTARRVAGDVRSET